MSKQISYFKGRKFHGYKLSRVGPENYDFMGINFRERPKNSRNQGSFYPRNFLPLKYSAPNVRGFNNSRVGNLPEIG